AARGDRRGIGRQARGGAALVRAASQAGVGGRHAAARDEARQAAAARGTARRERGDLDRRRARRTSEPLDARGRCNPSRPLLRAHRGVARTRRQVMSSLRFIEELKWRGLLHQTTASEAEVIEYLATPGRV